MEGSKDAAACQSKRSSKILFNNYSPKAKLILLNNPRDEVEGIIQQY